jgi:hypothetical protein
MIAARRQCTGKGDVTGDDLEVIAGQGGGDRDRIGRPGMVGGEEQRAGAGDGRGTILSTAFYKVWQEPTGSLADPEPRYALIERGEQLSKPSCRGPYRRRQQLARPAGRR